MDNGPSAKTVAFVLFPSSRPIPVKLSLTNASAAPSTDPTVVLGLVGSLPTFIITLLVFSGHSMTHDAEKNVK